MTTQALTINFHDTDLFVVEHSGQPYTPMKTIVEGMGLDWSSQLSKLNANPKRWGMVKIAIPTIGYIQETVCLPLRKLAGWLSTISPNKVKAELRETIIFYQDECDDALWEYWSKKQPTRYGLLDLPEPYTITKSQAGELYTIVTNKSASSGKPRAYYWSRFQNHFKLASYKDTPADRFDEAKTYLQGLEGNHELLQVTPLELDALVDQRVKKALEGEWLSHAKPENPQTDENGVTLFFPKLKNNRQRRWLVQQPRDEMVMYWTLDDDQEVMSWQDFRKKIAYEPTELQALIEQLPIDLLPGVMNTTARRLMACVR